MWWSWGDLNPSIGIGKQALTKLINHLVTFQNVKKRTFTHQYRQFVATIVSGEIYHH